MTIRGRAFVLGPGGGTEHRIAEDRFLTKGRPSERVEPFCVIEYEGAPGVPGPPIHIHRSFDEAWYILDGKVRFTAGGKTVEAVPGTYLLVPRGVPHGFEVAGRKPARWIGIFSPGRYVGLVEELGAVIPEAGPPDLRAIARLFAKYDSEIVPP